MWCFWGKDVIVECRSVERRSEELWEYRGGVVYLDWEVRGV